MNFIKKNKLKILFISIIFIILLSIFSNTLNANYESVEFKSGKVIAKTLNIRCGPGVNYKKIGTLSKGEYIDVFAKIDNWYIIKTKNNLIGAVSGKYIVSSESEEILVTSEEDATIETSSEFSNSNTLTVEETEFLNLINSNRKNNGLSELKIDYEVQNLARLKAEDLVKNNYFSHVSEEYGDMPSMLKDFNISYKTVGENIAGNKTLSGAIEAWMNSESHKTNILSKDYNYTGIAIAESEKYGKIFVQVFMGK